MLLNFSKMHGCGNDYIYFNCLKTLINNPKHLARVLSNRHYSIGADGIVLICPSDCADFKMRMFNTDGSEGKMCGNAIRCVAKYVIDEGLFNGDVLKIETLSGIKTITVTKNFNNNNMFTVDMGPAILEPAKIPVAVDLKQPLIAYDFKLADKIFKITCVSMGNPHCVIFFNDLNSVDFTNLGSQFEHNDFFPQGVNTEFVQVKNAIEIDMKVWERGSGATLACGTGACAAVQASVLNGYCNLNSDVTVNLPGGKLYVKVTKKTIYLTGTATLAFTGQVEVKS